MSIAVALEELRRTIDGFPGDPYLLTVGDDGRSHSVAAAPRWEGDELVVPAGRTSRANATARPLVVLLWPPPAHGEFSLIVDATARTDGDDVVLAPTRAVLHRRAVGGGNDCAPLL
jgi:hypothetical protein